MKIPDLFQVPELFACVCSHHIHKSESCHYRMYRFGTFGSAMHQALEIQEILLNIFLYCHSVPSKKYDPDVASLARTCRAFKEPALDVLWRELYDLSPLARCLPECAIRSFFPLAENRWYSFTRSLTPGEWDILQNYARRIRSLSLLEVCLDGKSLAILSNSPTTQPLFQNLRALSCYHADQDDALHLSHLPFPSLTSLSLRFMGSTKIKQCLESFSRFSPNLRKLELHQPSGLTHDRIGHSYTFRWHNLHTLVYHQGTLDPEFLAQLSRMPTLARLGFELNGTLPVFDPPLLFAYLQSMELYSWSLGPIFQFLSQVRLLGIMNFTACIGDSSSRKDLTFFFAGLQTSSVSNNIRTLRLNRFFTFTRENRQEAPVLGLDDLRPCMTFSNLRYLDVNVGWNVALTDSDLLILMLAWPRLEAFAVNLHWGWNMPGGITPNGLLQLLQACPSLCSIAVAIDTRGYTESPSLQENIGTTLPRPLHINVLNSVIEEQAVPAISAFFAAIALPVNIRGRGQLWNVVWNKVREGQSRSVVARKDSF